MPVVALRDSYSDTAGVDAGDFDEDGFFRAIATSGVRSLLIGRRALIALGLPVLTQDYDLWIHIDDIDRLNQAVAPLDLTPNRTEEAARRVGRYSLQNGMTVDVLVARAVPTIGGERVHFDDVWARRVSIDTGAGTSVELPGLDDLIATKRFAARPKDAEDVRLLLRIKERLGS